MLKKLLFITAICFVFNACNKQDKQNEYDDYDYDGIELIVVNKIPRGTYAGEEKYLLGWYEIGLSRNGEEPIEYIWHLGSEYSPYSHYIERAKIGDRGTIHLTGWAKQRNIKLRQPNAENPPIIGALGEVYWEKQK